MIPRIIHYCWFGRKPKPQQVIDYIDTWKRSNPDFQIKEWNEDNFDCGKLAYTREALYVKKYAFVSDVARLYALFTEGGIYLDTDVEVLQSFTRFLGDKLFLGKEAPFRISTAVIGAEKGSSIIKDLLDLYEDKHFITTSGALQVTVNTVLLTEYLNNTYPNWVNEVKIYDIDVFSTKLYPSGIIGRTDNTVSIHHFAASWWPKPLSRFIRLRLRLLRKLGII